MPVRADPVSVAFSSQQPALNKVSVYEFKNGVPFWVVFIWIFLFRSISCVQRQGAVVETVLCIGGS